MAYGSQAGRARTSASSPQAHAICDRCGFRYNHVDLKWQYDWRGAQLANVRVLVCDSCTDTPQEQLRAIVLPADPTPIINARVENFVTDEAGSATGQPYGAPVGLDPNAVMPLNNGVTYGRPLSLLSVTANGTTTIAVTCRVAHGLSTENQVAVEGLTNSAAAGFYSVNVTSAMAFTYTTGTAVAAGALLTPTTIIKTALVGLPYGYTTIPVGI